MEDISSLFNYRDPRSIRADQYSAQMRAPSGSLDEMTVQLGGNAGSLIGNALFGGQTSKMAEQSVLNEAIKESEVATDPDERLSLFSQALRKRGLEGYAQKVDNQLLERQKVINAKKNEAALAKLVQQKTNLPPEQAAALSKDAAAVRELMKDENSVETFNGQVHLVSKKTGNTVKTLGTAPDKSTKVINNLPGTSSDIVGFRKDLNTVVKPFRDAVNAADQAITLADDAINSGNFASAASLARSLAKASGEEQLSSRDVTAFGGDPSLVGSVSDITSRLMTGTPTKDTLLKLKSLATILKNKNSALENQELTKMQNLARISGRYSDAEINEVFDNRITPPGGGGGKFPNAPAVGTVKDGYRYNGGDPALQTSWSKK